MSFRLVKGAKNVNHRAACTPELTGGDAFSPGYGVANWSLPGTLSRMTESVVACTLGSRELETQALTWNSLRLQHEVDRVRTDQGVRLAFRDDPETEAELRALVSVESECCAWAIWTVTRDEGNRTLTLEVTSSGDGIPTLHAMFAGGS